MSTAYGQLPKRLVYAQVLICICLLLQMLLSFQLWWPLGRLFPMIPAFDFLPLTLSGSLLYWPAAIFAFLLILGICRPGDRRVLFAALFLAVILVLEDVNRLQVWFYQYCFMFLLIAFFRKGKEAAVYSNLQFILVAIYLWSGFNKLGVYYIEDTFPWLLGALGPLKSLGQYAELAIASALIEMFLGLGLLINRLRKFTLVLALAFHVFILLALGPLGHNWNIVVWPWNVCQAGLLLLLFYKMPFQGFKGGLRSFPLSVFTILLFGILPLLNLAHLWPDQLSFKMYSGTYTEGVFFAKTVDGTCLPEQDKVVEGQSLQGEPEYSLILDEWALSEMQVTPFVSEQIYLRMGRQFCACLEEPESGGIEILTAHRWSREAEEYKRLSCKELSQIE